MLKNGLTLHKDAKLFSPTLVLDCPKARANFKGLKFYLHFYRRCVKIH